MKKHRVSIISFMGMYSLSLYAVPPAIPTADKLSEFYKMETRDTNDWIKLADKYQQRKSEVVKRIINDWNRFRIKQAQEWKKLADYSPEGKENMVAKQLIGAVQMHEKHKKSWQDWWDNFTREVNEYRIKHAKELNEFTQRTLGNQVIRSDGNLLDEDGVMQAL